MKYALFLIPLLLLLIPRKVTASGIDLVKRFEKYSPTVYLDEGGRAHIGYGYLLQPGENIAYMSEPEAAAKLKSKINEAENVIDNYVTVPLTQNQYNALASFVYNIGVNAFIGSTLLKKLNRRDYTGAANEMLRWNKITKDSKKIVSQGLVRRRNIEKDLFLT